MSSRAMCPGCERPQVVCYCAHLEPIETRTRVVFLQHPRERDVPINSARIARRCLPNSAFFVGTEFGGNAALEALLHDSARPAALLFPAPDARDIRIDPPPGDVTLVVLDGTWSQAARLLRLNPTLRALPRYRLDPTQPSNYRIRRQPAEHCVSTLEALADVLGVLERDPERLARLRRPFDAMVDLQLAYVSKFAGRASRHVRTRRPRRPRPIPPLLWENPERVLLAYGEANVWPHAEASGRRPEIVHWVASRLGTGERFESVIAPRQDLASTASEHVRIPRERLLAGESMDAFRARWRAFLQPGDVLVTWGHFAADVLGEEGTPLPNRLDLRAVTSLYLGARTGALDECVVRVTDEPMASPWALGRAGDRMAAMERIAGTLSVRGRATFASALPDMTPP